MGMLFIIHLNLSPVLVLFCFLHFRHKMWVYDTISFHQGFIIFNHYILSMGFVFVCKYVRKSERVCAPARTYECVCQWVCICLYVCDQVCRYSTSNFVLLPWPLSCVVRITMFILSAIFKTWSLLLPSLWYLLWYSFLHKPPAFCSDPAQSKANVVSQTSMVGLQIGCASFTLSLLLLFDPYWEHKVFQ